MSEVVTFAWGIPLCRGGKYAETAQTPRSKGVRISCVAVGLIVMLGAILALTLNPNIGHFGTISAWTLFGLGVITVATGLLIKWVKEETKKNQEQTKPLREATDSSSHSEESSSSVSDPTRTTPTKAPTPVPIEIPRFGSGTLVELVKLADREVSGRVKWDVRLPEVIEQSPPAAGEVNEPSGRATHELIFAILNLEKAFKRALKAKEGFVYDHEYFSISKNGPHSVLLRVEPQKHKIFIDDDGTCYLRLTSGEFLPIAQGWSLNTIGMLFKGYVLKQFQSQIPTNFSMHQGNLWYATVFFDEVPGEELEINFLPPRPVVADDSAI
jgi:hypothetical protein